MLAIKRCLAFFIDYLFVMTYAALVFAIAINYTDNNTLIKASPIKGQIVGFLTLTIPVFLYFYLLEKSKNKATLGKKFFKLKVNCNTSGSILYRNILKFLPWEIAHVGVHWVVYYSKFNQPTPIWVYFMLIIPQLLVLTYFISMLLSKGKSSLYDSEAKTSVTLNCFT